MIRTPQNDHYCLESAAAITLRFQLLSARYMALQTKNSIRIVSTINPVTMENTAVSKRKWDTKEDKGKSMMHALYVLRYAKRHVSGQSNVEQGKNQAHSLSRYRVMLA